ncbi:MAG: hypothetical protein OHK0017_07190 [Patescibacteria group bacterium]
MTEKINKAKIVLVPGQGQGIQYLKNHDKSLTGQMYIFESLIREGAASLYNWARVNRKVGKSEFLNPVKFIRDFMDEYRLEKKYVNSQQAVFEFQTFINSYFPKILVGHSMGCNLLHNVIEYGDIPESVELIVFCQGDYNKNLKIKNQAIHTRINQKRLKIINIYQPLDPMLMGSVFVNRKVPAGLVGTSDTLIQNYFWIVDHFNLHQTSVRSPKLLKLINKYSNISIK